MQALHEKYGREVTVMGFPCNQFGAQEPKSNSEIFQFAKSNYRVQFPMFAKIDVNGPNAAPLYQYLKAETGARIGWNFGKFLVVEGKPTKYYGNEVGFDVIVNDIEEAIIALDEEQEGSAGLIDEEDEM